MVDLRTDYHIAINNISNWKSSYERKVYVHRKLLTNIMFRAICTKLVYDAFKNGEMVTFDNTEDAIKYVEEYYNGMAEIVNPKLMGWLRNMSNEEMVGTINFHTYKCMAYEAEIKDESMQDLEFIYVFEQLNDACVLFFIAYLLAGKTKKEALDTITRIDCTVLPKDDLVSLKEYFQPSIGDYMNENYQNHP